MPRCEMCGEWPDCPWKTDPEIMCGEYHPKPITNADRIRSMTDEELADWLGVYCNGQTAQEVGKPCVSDMGSCEECWLDWLKRESEDE